MVYDPSGFNDAINAIEAPEGSELIPYNPRGRIVRDTVDWGQHWWLDLIPELEAFMASWEAKLESDFQGDPAAAQAAFLKDLNATLWWADHTDTWRAGEKRRLTDPASWTEDLRVNSFDVKTFASGLGYELTDDQISSLATNMAYYDWTESEIERKILDTSYYNNGSAGMPTTGSVKTTYDAIMDMARNNLITVSDEWAWRQAHNIKSEATTAESVGQTIIGLAKEEHSFMDGSKFDALVAADMTLTDSLNPVLDAVKSSWEVQDLSLNDEWFADKLTTIDETTGDRRWVTSREATKLAHQDERYKNTEQHQTDMKQFSNGIFQMFGVR